jgi:hypothetical protein
VMRSPSLPASRLAALQHPEQHHRPEVARGARVQTSTVRGTGTSTTGGGDYRLSHVTVGTRARTARGVPCQGGDARSRRLSSLDGNLPSDLGTPRPDPTNRHQARESDGLF